MVLDTKGKLIETVNGVEIREKHQPDPLALVAGRRGRFAPGGPVYEVDRVGSGAAYIRRVYDPPVERTFQVGCEMQTIHVSKGPSEPGISRSARFVERVI
jgi:hypothetical protein